MLPIINLNNLLTWDQSLFDSCTVPDGVDLNVLVNTIVLNYGEMQLLYPDWAVMRYYAQNWFAAHKEQLDHLWADWKAEYNPVWNKDGTVEETETYDRNTDELPGSVLTESGSEEQQVKGYDSAGYTGASKFIPGRVQTASGKNHRDEDGTLTRTRREYGNIGVTMASQMLRDDLSFWSTFNFYDVAAKLFAVDFMVLVY